MSVLADGYHDVPDGKVASVVTHLQMFERPVVRDEVADPPWTLTHLPDPAADEYLALYRDVGTDWLWFSRLFLPRDDLATAIGDPKVEVYRLDEPGGETGILELDFRTPGECELVYFGVTAGLIGGGAARWMMNGRSPAPGRSRYVGSGCTPARWTIRGRRRSTSAPASPRFAGRSRSRTTHGLSDWPRRNRPPRSR